MRVSIINVNKIKNLLLPSSVEGSFWISDTDSNGIKRNLISIDADNNRWKLCSNKEVYYIDNSAMRQPFVYLEENKFYTIKNDIEKKTFLIYCSPTNISYDYYQLNEQLESGISIGSSNGCIISYNFLEAMACSIKQEENKIYIIDNNSKYGVYVNNVRVSLKKELKTGDILFIVGLKLVILIYKNLEGAITYYLGISNYSNVQVKLLSVSLPLIINLEYKELDDETEYALYDESEYFHRTPRFVERVKTLELNVDAPPTKVEDNNNSILLTIGPMLTMSMTSLVVGYTALSNVLSGGSTWGKAMPSLVICFAMFASVFVWPLFSKR